ncbi:hypothetical protein P7C71_g3521, partial [Lecanoromycetidae sp. Uapishka_2]
MSSDEKANGASTLKQASLYEPSPASTYGDTIGSSVPATPQDAASHTDLIQSLQAAQIDPAIQTISGSPMSGQQAKKPEELLRLQSQASLSPVKQGKLADVFGNPSTNSSPSSDKQKMIRDSPTWRHSAQQSDNVFSSSPQAVISPPLVREVQAVKIPVLPIVVPKSQSPGTLLRDSYYQRVVFLLPSKFRIVQHWSLRLNASSLVSTMAEDQLEHHVQTVFMQFGDCFTKVKRDGKNMPFAFVQYHNADDAKKAITEGRGLVVAGRPCRAEAAKVHLYGLDMFAFIEFLVPDMAVNAVQGAQGVTLENNVLRVEFKKSLDPGHRRGGSPRSRVMGGSPIGMSAYQQGVIAGRAQAGTQTLPPPVYPSPYYYSPLSPPTFGQYPGNNAPMVNQPQGSSFMTPSMGQFQQTGIPDPYLYSQIQAPIQAPIQTQVPAQVPAQQQSLYQSSYEWPLANNGSDNADGDH